MALEWIRFIISALLIIVGLFITICGVLGFYKFKFVLNRMHAAALIDTLGLFFVLVGLIVAFGLQNKDGTFNIGAIKMLLIIVFLWLSSPVSSHLISKLIYMTDTNTDKETNEIQVNDFSESQGKEDEQNGIND